MFLKALGAKPEIKKWAKKTMPFVQFVKARIEEFGLAALDLTLDFDEAEVLLDNLDYLTSTLQMEGVDVKFASEANEKIQEECRPGTYANKRKRTLARHEKLIVQ